MISQTFTTFFLVLAGIITLMLINEEKLIALEEKHDRKRAVQKKQKSKTHGKNR